MRAPAEVRSMKKARRSNPPKSKERSPLPEVMPAGGFVAPSCLVSMLGEGNNAAGKAGPQAILDRGPNNSSSKRLSELKDDWVSASGRSVQELAEDGWASLKATQEEEWKELRKSADTRRERSAPGFPSERLHRCQAEIFAEQEEPYPCLGSDLHVHQPRRGPHAASGLVQRLPP